MRFFVYLLVLTVQVIALRGPALAEQPLAQIASAQPAQTAAIQELPQSNLETTATTATTPVPSTADSATAATQAGPDQVSLPKAKPIIQTAVKVQVNLTRQRMSVYENGKLKYTWRISSGWGHYRTPNGNYSPTWVKRMHYSRKYNNSPMPYSIFFHRGYAIHGTGAIRSLGRPASHGCVRLHPANAKRLYRLVRKHGKAATKISITGRTPYVKKRRYARRYKKKTYSFWPFGL